MAREHTASSAGSHGMTREQAEPLTIAAIQQDFRAQPPSTQAETLARVDALLAAEATRGQAQPSALKRYVKAGAWRR